MLHLPDLEKDLLYSLLNGTPDISRVMQIVTADTFSDAVHRVIFKAIRQLYDQEQEINDLSVYDYIDHNCQNTTTYYVALSEVMQRHRSDATASYMAQILEEYHKRRLLHQAGVKLQSSSDDLTHPLLDSIEDARHDLDQITLQQETTVTTLGQERSKVMAKIEENQSDARRNQGLLCGIRQIDADGGLCEDGLVVIGGKSSHGKTMLLDLIALNVASRGQYVAFFSLEMNREKVAARVLSMQSLVDNNRLRRKKLTPEELSRVKAADQKLSEVTDSHLLFESAPTFEQMLINVRNLHCKYHLALVVVDYIQLLHISSDKHNETTAKLIGTASHRMHDLGMSMHLTFAVTSQINRGYIGEPNGNALRDSGEIYEAADQVMILWNASKEVPPIEKYPSHYRLFGEMVPTLGNLLVKMEKNRDGRTFYFFMGFIPQCALLCDLSDRDRLLALGGFELSDDSSETVDNPSDASAASQMVIDMPF